MWVLMPGEVANARRVDLAILVTVPVGFWDYVRVVRMSERGNHAEWPPVPTAREVEQLLACCGDDFIIEVNLVGPCTRTGLRDRIHGVIPTRPLLETGPIGGPAEVRRVDVGC